MRGEAVQELFRLHYLGLVRLAMRFVGDQETAEDLVQDVFLGLARRSTPTEDPQHYLRRAVVNRSRSALRRRKIARAFLARGEPGSIAEAADEATVRDDARTHMLRAIAALPLRQREAVVLRYYEDLSVTEIAATLNVSPGAVSSALNRALATLSLTTEHSHAG